MDLRINNFRPLQTPLKTGPTSTPEQPKDRVEIGKAVLRNRISAMVNTAAVSSVAGAGTWAGLALSGGPVGSVLAAIVGGIAGLAVAFNFAERSRADLLAPLRKLSSKIADLFHGKAEKIKAGAEELKIAMEPTLSPDHRQEFIDKLQPGDIVLNCSANSLMFVVIPKLFGGKCDYTHAMVYEGDGQVIHSTGAKGSHRSSIDDTLANSAKAIAIRPRYKDGQSQAVREEAAKLIGRGYDWLPSLDDKKLGCSELVYHAVMRGVPESQMPMFSVLGYSYPAPRDFLSLKDAEIVAEAGSDKSFWNSLKSVFRVS